MPPDSSTLRRRKHLHQDKQSYHGVFEKRVAALEGGVASLAVSSGHAAQFITLTSLMRKGDNFISSPFLYGGTFNQFKVTLPGFGIEARFTPDLEPESFEN
jgi:O-acetylhomoserine (thiol)-lyase